MNASNQTSGTADRKPALSTLSIGGATFDLFLTLKDALKENGDTITLKVGGKLPVSRVIETSGGGACNTSVGLQRLGCDARFCGVLGSDQWGEKLLKGLRNEGVNTESATIVEGETSSFSVILSLPNGDRTILYAAGVNEHLHDTTFDVAAMKEVQAVYLNHLCDTSCMIENDIIEGLQHIPDVHLTWNPGGSQIKDGMKQGEKATLLKCTNLLILNKEEAIEFSDAKTLEEAIPKFLDAGVKNVIVTDGSRGTIGSDGKKFFSCPVIPDARIVDTTGAGDAFGTGATWAILRGRSLPESMVSGTLNATSVIGAIGAQAGLLTEAEMLRKLASPPIPVTERHL